jgi:hypothetical protein
MYRAALIALALAGVAHADDSDAPVHYRSHGMTVVLHRSTKPIHLAAGDNLIGAPHTFTCVSTNGCVVTMAASLEETNIASTENYTCSSVDGVPGIPACTVDTIAQNTFLSNTNQQLKVGTGPHTIQTVVNAAASGSKVLSWQTEYTIYELPVEGAD